MVTRIPGKRMAALVMVATLVLAVGAWWWLEDPAPDSSVEAPRGPSDTVPDDTPGTRKAEDASAPAPSPSDARSDDVSNGPNPTDDETPVPAPQTDAAQLLAQCQLLKSERRWDEALGCVRQVLAADPDNAEARDEERNLEMLVAFSMVHGDPSVEGWFEFIRDYPWSPFVDGATEGLRELEVPYWEEVKAADTPERYRRYLEIYPVGRYVDEARRRLSDGGA